MIVSSYADLAAELSALGLIARGGFAVRPEDGLDGVATLVLVGNAGPAFWPAFAAGRRTEPDPLDAWVRRALEPVARRVGARVAMPDDGPPYHPFQQWAMRAEPVHPAPLGLLIHPAYGLWHAYRAALLFPTAIGLPEPPTAASPCETCVGRPCLSACPVGAFDASGYDVDACRGHAGGPDGAACRDGGCLARHACPVGRDYAYGPEQQAFHMAAFLPRSRQP
ncbi:ferredoxin [Thalassobaculum salexigens]|uniref:ferredoxin n=1 Tax=Thalassobaculum salexigens TaxID=455360 RepID=UPI00248DA4A2|nr:ferredoxin [Thalassobaculum salexigens]